MLKTKAVDLSQQAGFSKMLSYTFCECVLTVTHLIEEHNRKDGLIQVFCVPG